MDEASEFCGRKKKERIKGKAGRNFLF